MGKTTTQTIEKSKVDVSSNHSTLAQATDNDKIRGEILKRMIDAPVPLIKIIDRVSQLPKEELKLLSTELTKLEKKRNKRNIETFKSFGGSLNMTDEEIEEFLYHASSH